MFLQLMAAGVLSASAPVGPRIIPVGFSQPVNSMNVQGVIAGDTVIPKRPRPRAVDYSDAYYLRLRIHQIASYAELPLFASEYYLGQRLLNEERSGSPSDGLKTAHTTVALGLGALFTINTITGGWNLWESRKEPAGRTLRIVHSVAMLGADAGFALAGATGGDADENEGGSGANRHRAIAISSMALATAGTVMMWLFH